MNHVHLINTSIPSESHFKAVCNKDWFDVTDVSPK